ncbi:hypothetical protein V0U79_01050 [Hyphobacterium sp. HN65]|uniref:Polymer-forming cytoskeletal protein n=1 Tax=Hyphobacterium lacteum TaxID=3116575 RepID=A0ABU7LM24_9PROT|nr:hypothetical protein [Hyphobacterium sp. HN65]MEE2524938.1 hypothetical protein [Hyphobacterium sp. HN65]
MFFRTLLLAAGLAVFPGVSAQAQHFGGHVEFQNVDRDGELVVIAGSAEVSGRIRDDLTVYAGSIEVDAEIDGDTQIAGGNVMVTGHTRGDAEIAGGSVEIEMNIDGNADLAGGYVTYTGAIGGNLDAGAGIMEIGRNAVINGSSDFAGQELILRGTFRSDVDIFAEEVVLEGTFDGDLDIEAERLTIADSAVINGQVVYEGPREARIAEGATLASPVDYTYRDIVIDWDERHFDHINLDLDIIPAAPVFIGLGIAFDFLLGLLAIIFMPRGVARVSRKFAKRPLASSFVGVLLFPMGWVMLLMAGIVLLAVTLVGILLIPFWVTFALLVLMLAYPLGCIAVSECILQRTGIAKTGTGIRILGLLATLILVAALWVVPPLAIIAGFILSWIGLGAWMFAAFGRKDDLPPANEAAAEAEAV